MNLFSKELLMKKLLIFIIPVILILVSTLSYLGFNKYYNSFNNYSINIAGTNRPPNQSNRIAGKIVLILIDNLDAKSFKKSDFYKNNAPLGLNGECLISPINDNDYNILELLSGARNNLFGYNTKINQNYDNLILVANNYGLKTMLIGTSGILERLDPNIKIKPTILQNDSSKIRSLIDSFEIEKPDLTILELNTLALAKNRNDYEKRFKILEPDLNTVISIFPKGTIFFVSSLMPYKSFEKVILPKKYFHLPFLFFGDKIKTSTNGITLKSEDFTATIAYSLGIPQPTYCMGIPNDEIFNNLDKEKFDNLNYYIHTYIQNSLYRLTSIGLDESIVEGFYVDSTDSIDLSKPSTLNELKERISIIRENFETYDKNSREKNNIIFTIISIIIFIGLLTVWLLLLPKKWRGFLFGGIFMFLFVVFNYLLLGKGIIFPDLQYFSFSWMILNLLPSLAISTIIVTALMTLMGGYMLNISLKEIIISFEEALGTVMFILVLESSFLIIRQGLLISKVSPILYSQFLIFRNLTLGFLLFFIFILMTGIAYLIYYILTRKNQNAK
jgi:hypothetical protein